MSDKPVIVRRRSNGDPVMTVRQAAQGLFKADQARARVLGGHIEEEAAELRECLKGAPPVVRERTDAALARLKDIADFLQTWVQ